MNNQVEEIKRRLDIVKIIGSYIKLKKAGANFKAPCPFHNEKDPSFIVSPSKQIWHCFGACDEGGDIFSFVMKMEGIDFPEALQLLADKAGVALKKQDPQTISKKQQLLELHERAVKYFVKCLSVYKPAQDYLKKRSLRKKTIKAWRLGYAPIKNKIKHRNLAMFRDRIMIPIFDFNGRVIGFTGRIMPDNPQADKIGKYINSPDSLIYKKSLVLFGLDKAKEYIRKTDKTILVEGNMDVICLHQYGFKNAVGSSGSALSQDQLQSLSRLSKNLILCFDMDEAGKKTTQRTIELARNLGMDIKIMTIPAKDPADLLGQAKGSKKFKKAINNAVPVMEYYFKQTFDSNFDVGNVKHKKQAGKFLLLEISKIFDKIEQAHWIQKLSNELQIDESYLWQALQDFEPGQDSDISSSSQLIAKKTNTRQEKLEKRLAGLCFLQKQKHPLCKKYKEQKKHLVLEIEQEQINDIKQEIKNCQQELKKIILNKKRQELTEQVKKLEKQGKYKELNKIVKKFALINKKLAQLK